MLHSITEITSQSRAVWNVWIEQSIFNYFFFNLPPKRALVRYKEYPEGRFTYPFI